MMLCPCCGCAMHLGESQCRCGARFVGKPLGEPLAKVQHFGPTVTAVLLLVVVVSAALTVTKFLAFAAVLVVWAALRAIRLARKDPAGYGGYRTATATLILTLTAGAVSSGFAIAHIPRFLQNRRARQAAFTQAGMYHTWKLLDDYKRRYGSYPADELTVEQDIPEPLPRDYWAGRIAYQGYTNYLVEGGSGGKRTSIAINNFELRSAGPDEKMGTEDDIIMRDGIFYTDAEARKQSLVQAPAKR